MPVVSEGRRKGFLVIGRFGVGAHFVTPALVWIPDGTFGSRRRSALGASRRNRVSGSVTKTKTRIDPTAFSRALENEPMQLREWGTDRVFALPPHREGDWVIGSGLHVWLRISDAERFVSRKHATLALDHGTWSIRDNASTNGLWIDGQRVERALLEPGMEIGLGRRRLIVESPRVARIRALLSRFLGWGVEARPRVDRALRAVRDFEARRSPLWLTGTDDLPNVARRVHTETATGEPPIEVLDIDRARGPIELSSSNELQSAVCLASRGSVDVALVRALFESRPNLRIIVCARTSDCGVSVDIPPLSSRAAELERVIAEYAVDAALKLDARGNDFAVVDRVRLLEHPPDTLAEIEVATLRLIAVRRFGGITNAAQQLGITHSALSRWYARFMGRAPRRSRDR